MKKRRNLQNLLAPHTLFLLETVFPQWLLRILGFVEMSISGDEIELESEVSSKEKKNGRASIFEHSNDRKNEEKEVAEFVSGIQIVSSVSSQWVSRILGFIEMSISGDAIEQETGNHGPISGHDVVRCQMNPFRFGTPSCPGNRNRDRNCWVNESPLPPI
ncbi:hypothetical protein CDAR_61511 [Caerostris darwini]|uniref:Uncharacterized protein n=1 Tax=Caerostris darwini TaxID=1538125 RepID=A0AAV4UK78_9ARAC|nr:hypothetical protein CDAR_61511 [Caerostris darwini]